jgi:Ni,Fe-hydrogenase I cytochrome b subunit
VQAVVGVEQSPDAKATGIGTNATKMSKNPIEPTTVINLSIILIFLTVTEFKIYRTQPSSLSVSDVSLSSKIRLACSC